MGPSVTNQHDLLDIVKVRPFPVPLSLRMRGSVGDNNQGFKESGSGTKTDTDTWISHTTMLTLMILGGT